MKNEKLNRIKIAIENALLGMAMRVISLLLVSMIAGAGLVEPDQAIEIWKTITA